MIIVPCGPLFALSCAPVPSVQQLSDTVANSMRVFIIEEHTEALEVLSLCVRRKVIHPWKCRMIHFDSHPDLSCFDTILPEHIKDRTELCHRLRNSEDGISSFILPSLSMGLLKDVVWVRPPWTDQIPLGEHQLTFGWVQKEKEQKMAIATDLSYWRDDGHSVSCPEDLLHSTTFSLSVVNLQQWRCDDDDDSSETAPTTKVTSLSDDNIARKKPRTEGRYVPEEWVLDICLDYFSCANPLQEPDLPEHISTPEEIKCMLRELQSALEGHARSGWSLPSCCIIARSEQDGFTPGLVAAELEQSVLEMLQTVYGKLKVLRVPSFEVFYDPEFIRGV